MKKIHTRMKRKLGLGTGRSRYFYFHPKKRTVRPKTFKDEDAAKRWADKQELTSYELITVKRNRRFQIVEPQE